MKPNERQYFTAGEFARLFGISKQTLFYYERNQIFKPDCIDSKGYRYYSLSQYFIFEIITALRMLHIPLKKIAWYIQNRNVENLQSLLQEKWDEYEKVIQIMLINQSHLLEKIRMLEEARHIRIDKITLENRPEETIVRTKLPDGDPSLKEIIQTLSLHNQPLLSGPIINASITGYILPMQDMKEGRYDALSFLYTPVPAASSLKNRCIKPAGLYATIYKRDSYHTKYIEGLEKLELFIQRNDLAIIGDAYLYPIRNYWSTSHTDDYITRISIPVDYKEE